MSNCKNEIIKLSYFNGRGLAENARILLALANVDYIDHRYPIEVKDYSRRDFVMDEFNQDKAEGKLTKSMNKLPYLEIDNQVIFQSKAIERYLARKYNMMGTNEIESAQIDAICECIRDFKQDYLTLKKDTSMSKQDAINKWFTEIMPSKLEMLDQIVGDMYAVGNAISIADIVIYSFIYDYFDNKEAAILTLKNSPKISFIANQIYNNNHVKTWTNNRPITPF